MEIQPLQVFHVEARATNGGAPYRATYPEELRARAFLSVLLAYKVPARFFSTASDGTVTELGSWNGFFAGTLIQIAPLPVAGYRPDRQTAQLPAATIARLRDLREKMAERRKMLYY